MWVSCCFHDAKGKAVVSMIVSEKLCWLSWKDYFWTLVSAFHSFNVLLLFCRLSASLDFDFLDEGISSLKGEATSHSSAWMEICPCVHIITYLKTKLPRGKIVGEERASCMGCLRRSWWNSVMERIVFGYWVLSGAGGLISVCFWKWVMRVSTEPRPANGLSIGKKVNGSWEGKNLNSILTSEIGGRVRLKKQLWQDQKALTFSHIYLCSMRSF